MNPNDTAILNALPATWQALWGEPLTTRCAGCGEGQTFTDLGAITTALLRPCPSCLEEDLDAFDPEGRQVSVRCGSHGSAIGVLACRCVVSFSINDGEIGTALLMRTTDAPVTCASCKVGQQGSGALDLKHTALICLVCLLGILRKAQANGIPVCVVDDGGAQLRWTEVDDGDDATLIDVRDVVDMHCVIPDHPGEPFDFHTHGLEKFDHPEFQVLAPGYCRAAMASLLWNHVERVINAGERFAAGETVTVDGIVCGYEVVPGDSDDDGLRLRIIDVTGGCKCQTCEATDRKEDGDK